MFKKFLLDDGEIRNLDTATCSKIQHSQSRTESFSMSRNYDLLLRVLRKWPVDKSKGTRCYAFHLRELARKAFPTGNIFRGSEAENQKKLMSLLRLSENKYGNECPYRKSTGASGYILADIKVRLSEEFVNKHCTRIKTQPVDWL